MARHQCLSCEEPFEAPEFYSYMLRLRSKTVNCLRCSKDNFIVPNRNAVYFLLLLFSALLGFFIFCFVNLAFSMATNRTGWLPLFGGGILGLGSARLIMNLFNWRFGFVSQDRKYKSVADFE